MKIQTTKIFSIVDNAINQFDIVDGQKKRKYTTISAQGSSRSSKTYNILIRLILFITESWFKIIYRQKDVAGIKGDRICGFQGDNAEHGNI